MSLSEKEIKEVVSLLHEAGKEILRIYNTGSFSTRMKSDNSPVTLADIASDNIIKSGLKRLTPGIPVFSEETKDVSFAERSAWKTLWILDPLDGTREFIARNDQFCISLALVTDNRPAAGFIHSPVTSESWYAVRSAGAFRVRGENRAKLPLSDTEGPLVVNISQSHHIPEEAMWIEELKRKYELEISSCGSALKFCRIAEGSTDIYPKFGPIHEWDVAAGELIVEEAGGSLLERSSKRAPLYNKEDYHQAPFIAVSRRVVRSYGSEIFRLL